MKNAFGPNVTNIAPLKSATCVTITDRGKQMERGLYSKETIVTETAVQNPPRLLWKSSTFHHQLKSLARQLRP